MTRIASTLPVQDQADSEPSNNDSTQVGGSVLHRRLRPSGSWCGEGLLPLLIVASLALAVRALLYSLSSRPFFMSDSGEYLEVAHRFFLPPSRPVGLSLFYQVMLAVWHDLRMLVVAQALLGVASAVLATSIARLAGVHG